MSSTPAFTDTQRYAKTIEASKRVRWDIDRDVIRGREFHLADRFLPEGLSLVDELPWLDAREKLFMSQVQGRTYANMFGLVERFIGAKMLEVSRDHWLGDQTALEAIVRFTDEELKHQALFRRIEALVAARMPAGYRFDVAPDDVAGFVLGKSTWAVLALTCHIELFSQAHYRASIEGAEAVAALQGCLPVPLEGGIAARDHRRAGVGPRGREARFGRRARPGVGRPDRTDRRRRRHPAGASPVRRGVLSACLRHGR